MGKVRAEGKKLIFERKDELTVIEPYGENCLRCRSTRNGKIMDENWTVLPPATPDHCVIEGDAEKMKISNGMISAVVEAGNPWYGGVVTYYKKDGGEEKQLLRTKFEGDYTNRNRHVEGDHYQIQMIFEANEGEHFYGMGDRKSVV